MLKHTSKFIMLSSLCLNLHAQDNPVNLNSITVTAQKQEENVQKVPISMNVFDEIQVEDQNIKTISDVADLVPNFTVLENGMNGVNTPVMRGIFAHIETGALGTGLYVDGVPSLNATTFENEFLNIERIEVLKGPQSTLYGKNSTMGVINIITKDPDEDEIKVHLDLGSDSYKSIGTSLTKLLFDDKLIFNLNVKKDTKDGFIKNKYKNELENDREKLFTSANLKYLIDDKNSIKINYTRTKFDDGGFDMLPYGKKTVNSGLDTFNKAKNTSMYFKYEHDFNENLSFSSLSSKYESIQNEQTDYDFSPLAYTDYYNKSTTKELNQEFKVNYQNDKFKLVSGLYLSKFEENTLTNTNLSDYLGFPFIDNKNRLVDAKTYALFSQLDYKLNEKFNLILGARYEQYRKDFKDRNSNLKLDNKWSDISPKIVLQYALNDKSNIYASVSKGYKSGGYNIFMNNGSDEKYYKFDDETLISYEIGSKNSFLDDTLILNTAIYYMDINDMQVQQPVTSSSSYIANAAEATGKGFEIDANYRINNNLSALLGFGYSDVKFDKFKEDILDNVGNKIGEEDYSGNQNYYAPKYNYNLGLKYRTQSGFYSNINLIGYSKTYLDRKNKYKRDPYKIVNAKIGYEMDNLDIYIYGKNIFDEKYDQEGYFSGNYTIPSKPRHLGVQLRYRF